MKAYWISIYEKVAETETQKEYGKKATVAIQNIQESF